MEEKSKDERPLTVSIVTKKLSFPLDGVIPGTGDDERL
jgi:type II secretory pathway component PulC